jgi:recombination protein RecT
VPANAVATIRGLLEARSAELEAGLRTFGISAERFKSVALAQFSRKPDLWACEPLSVYRALKEAADYGLEPTGSIGGAHLVPYGNQATLLIDYRGLVRMVRRSGEIARVEARVVRRDDAFEFHYGLDPDLRHVPALVPDPGPLAYVYAVAIFRDGDRQFDVMSAAEVEAIRQRSRAKNAGPWVTDHFEMAKKTVLRRLCKLLPLDDITRTALAREDEREGEHSGPERAGAVISRQAQLREQIAAQVAPQLAEVTGVPEGVQGTGAPTGEAIRAVEAQASDPPREPTTDVAGKPVATAAQAEQVATEVLVEQATAEEAAPPSTEPVDGQRTMGLAEQQIVDEQAATQAACGATVGGPDGTTYSCTLARGHRGEHTDGQHDWPR